VPAANARTPTRLATSPPGLSAHHSSAEISARQSSSIAAQTRHALPLNAPSSGARRAKQTRVSASSRREVGRWPSATLDGRVKRWRNEDLLQGHCAPGRDDAGAEARNRSGAVQLGRRGTGKVTARWARVCLRRKRSRSSLGGRTTTPQHVAPSLRGDPSFTAAGHTPLVVASPRPSVGLRATVAIQRIPASPTLVESSSQFADVTRARPAPRSARKKKKKKQNSCSIYKRRHRGLNGEKNHRAAAAYVGGLRRALASSGTIDAGSKSPLRERRLSSPYEKCAALRTVAHSPHLFRSLPSARRAPELLRPSLAGPKFCGVTGPGRRDARPPRIAECRPARPRSPRGFFVLPFETLKTAFAPAHNRVPLTYVRLGPGDPRLRDPEPATAGKRFVFREGAACCAGPARVGIGPTRPSFPCRIRRPRAADFRRRPVPVACSPRARPIAKRPVSYRATAATNGEVMTILSGPPNLSSKASVGAAPLGSALGPTPEFGTAFAPPPTQSAASPDRAWTE